MNHKFIPHFTCVLIYNFCNLPIHHNDVKIDQCHNCCYDSWVVTYVYVPMLKCRWPVSKLNQAIKALFESWSRDQCDLQTPKINRSRMHNRTIFCRSKIHILHGHKHINRKHQVTSYTHIVTDRCLSCMLYLSPGHPMQHIHVHVAVKLNWYMYMFWKGWTSVKTPRSISNMPKRQLCVSILTEQQTHIVSMLLPDHLLKWSSVTTHQLQHTMTTLHYATSSYGLQDIVCTGPLCISCSQVADLRWQQERIERVANRPFYALLVAGQGFIQDFELGGRTQW